MSIKSFDFKELKFKFDRAKCQVQPMPEEWKGLWEQLQARQSRANRKFSNVMKELQGEPIHIQLKPENHMHIHAPLNLRMKVRDNASPAEKEQVRRHNRQARKFARKQRWQKIKQNTARFLAKVVFRGDVSFRGATRVVILRRNTVIKFPRFWSLEVFLRGWLCNICERNNWNILDKYFQNKLADGRPVKVCFAPVLRTYFFGFFVIMQRAAPVTEAEIKNQLADWLLNKDWKLISDFCSDPNMDNFGRLNGDIVVIDYAQ